MKTNIENAARELTTDELGLVSGGTIVLEDAAPTDPTMKLPAPVPPGPYLIGL